MSDPQSPQSNVTVRTRANGGPLCWLQLACFGIATSLAGYLALVALRGGAVAGCGLESPCARVLQSRWAYWFGLPVSIPAVAAYFALWMAAWRRRFVRAGSAHPLGPRWAVPLAAIIIVAALWFVFLQVAVIRAFCFLCLLTHLSAAGGAVLVLFDPLHASRAAGERIPHAVVQAGVGALLGLGLLISGQFVGTPKMHGVSALPASAVSSPAPGARRMLSLHNGQFQLDLKAFPSIGRASAPHVAVSLFDYTCSHCRAMDMLLEDLQHEIGDRLMILLVPVPLDGRCNHLVRQTADENAHACEYARLGLAVWLANPDAFARFHSWLLMPARPPTPEDARREAERLVGTTSLQQAIGDERIARQLRLGIDLFAANSQRAGVSQLPQLMLKKTVSVGPIQSADALRLILQEEFGVSTGG